MAKFMKIKLKCQDGVKSASYSFNDIDTYDEETIDKFVDDSEIFHEWDSLLLDLIEEFGDPEEAQDILGMHYDMIDGGESYVVLDDELEAIYQGLSLEKKREFMKSIYRHVKVDGMTDYTSKEEQYKQAGIEFKGLTNKNNGGIVN